MDSFPVRVSKQIVRALLFSGPSSEEIAAAMAQPRRERKMELLEQVMHECPRVPFGADPDERFAVLSTALTEEPDVFVLSYLVRVVSHLGGAATLRVLTPLLSHRDARVVSNTLEAMARTGDETVFTLALPLVGREEPRVRATALAVMCKYDRVAAVEAMVNFLKMATRPEPRRGALLALKAVGGVPTGILRELLDEVDDPEVQAGLSRILEEAAPDGLGRLALRVKHRLRFLSATPAGKRVQALVRRLRGWPAVAIVSCGLVVGAVLLIRGLTSTGEASLVALGSAQGKLRPATVAAAHPLRFVGTRATWIGDVTGVRGRSFVANLGGGTASVEPRQVADMPRPGDRVEIDGRIQGRTAAGLIYVEDAVLRVLARSGGSEMDRLTDRSFVGLAATVDMPIGRPGTNRSRVLAEAEREWAKRR